MLIENAGLLRQQPLSLISTVPLRATVSEMLIGIAGLLRQQSLSLVSTVPVRATVNQIHERAGPSPEQWYDFRTEIHDSGPEIVEKCPKPIPLLWNR